MYYMWDICIFLQIRLNNCKYYTMYIHMWSKIDSYHIKHTSCVDFYSIHLLPLLLLS